MQKTAYLKTFFDSMVLPYFVVPDLNVHAGQWYVVQTKFGKDLALAKTDSKEHQTDMPDPHENSNENNASVQTVLRPAEKKEIDEHFQFRQEEEEAFEIALQQIKDFDLQMKLINVHILLGRKKIVFNFTSDNRVDFRQLVKKLASLFKTRIEMRQIGVRDAAKILGGLGVCGETCCCLKSNCHTNSIYLKMAKDQGFVVNSSKLTGICGRLMCCLAYENDFYVEEKKKYPLVGSYLKEENKYYRIFSVNLIKNEIFASDEHHHQKKFGYESISFTKKDKHGNSVYEFIKNFSKKSEG